MAKAARSSALKAVVRQESSADRQILGCLKSGDVGKVIGLRQTQSGSITHALVSGPDGSTYLYKCTELEKLGSYSYESYRDRTTIITTPPASPPPPPPPFRRQEKNESHSISKAHINRDNGAVSSDVREATESLSNYITPSVGANLQDRYFSTKDINESHSHLHIDLDGL